ncbi:Hypothetical_protein [Hexamita inflata]|uniref:Hypothetical_protein n=1 Tax=Hexamita inflata TaxID=28002 RepID=A0AA86U1D8_9EUKA|nr:Hypothetical protein HINF_LOCUS25920 [Hexamita inflata]
MLNECDLCDISALKPLVNLEYLSVSGNQIYYFYPIRGLDAIVYVHGNLIVESSDYFTFFKLQDKSQFIKQPPTKQQMQLAQKMKMVDTTTQCIRDINTKRKNYLSSKQVTTATLVIQLLYKQIYKQQYEFLSFTDKVVQLLTLLVGQDECQ